MPNELTDGKTNYVLGEQGTTAFTGSTRITDAHFASEISPKITFKNKSRFLSSCFDLGWTTSDKAHYGKALSKDDAICMA